MLSDSNYNALKKYRGGLYTGPSFTEEIRYFRDCGYITATSRVDRDFPGSFSMNPTEWTLTSRGDDALAEFEYVRQKDADTKRQQRFENKISVATVLVPAITFVLGLIVEHCSGILGVLFEFFG